MRRVAIALLAGLCVTLLSGLLYNRTIYGELPNVRVASEPILGVGYWGYILPWLRKVVYPGSSLQVIWRNLCVDVAIWGLAVYALFRVGMARRDRACL